MYNVDNLELWKNQTMDWYRKTLNHLTPKNDFSMESYNSLLHSNFLSSLFLRESFHQLFNTDYVDRIDKNNPIEA